MTTMNMNTVNAVAAAVVGGNNMNMIMNLEQDDMRNVIQSVKFAVGDLIKPNRELGGIVPKDDVSGENDASCIIEVTAVNEGRGGIQSFEGKLVAHESDKYYTKGGKLKEKEVKKHSFLYVLATEKEVEAMNNLHKPIKKGKAARKFKNPNCLIQLREFEDGSVESSLNKKFELKPETDPERIELVKEMLDIVDESGWQGLLDARNEGKFEGKLEVFTNEAKKENFYKLKDFILEFDYATGLRLPNTLAHMYNTGGMSAAIEHIDHYFDIVEHRDYDIIKEKVKSIEFAEIVKNLSFVSDDNWVNRRLAIWYSDPGAGKSYAAQKEADYVITCHSGMYPEDLCVKVNFQEGGKISYEKTALVHAMMEGKCVVLEEGNHLPYNSLKFLQTVLDGTKEFCLENTDEIIHIKDGFRIIITMNLRDGEHVQPLPLPIADRAYEIKRFEARDEAIFSVLG